MMYLTPYEQKESQEEKAFWFEYLANKLDSYESNRELKFASEIIGDITSLVKRKCGSSGCDLFKIGLGASSPEDEAFYYGRNQAFEEMQEYINNIKNLECNK